MAPGVIPAQTLPLREAEMQELLSRGLNIGHPPRVSRFGRRQSLLGDRVRRAPMWFAGTARGSFFLLTW